MTDNEGNFLFVGIIKEGRYILRLNSQKFIGETAITVGLFNISGIEIFAYNIKKEKKLFISNFINIVYIPYYFYHSDMFSSKAYPGGKILR